MQALGPVENGKKWSSSLFAPGSSHRSGLNSSGESNIRGSVMTPIVGTLTMVLTQG